MSTAAVITSEDPADPVLLREVLAGRLDAYEHLVRRYQRSVFRIALRLLGDAGEADCVTQDAFLKAYRALHTLRGGASFESWLIRIATNLCYDRLRRPVWLTYFHQWDDDGEAAVSSHASPAPTDSPERQLLAQELREVLARALDALAPQQRAVFVLRHLEGMSLQEIAAALSIETGTVKAHLFRATHRLRERLSGGVR